MATEHRSPWGADSSAAAYPALTNERRFDVAVVGGGITGVTTALLARRAGLSVCLLEARTLAAGTTGRTTGKVSAQHGVRYRSLIERHGEAKARLYADANSSAVEVVGAFVDELGADADFGRADAFVYTQEEAARATLHDEAEAAASLGLPAEFTTELDLPLRAIGAVRFRDQAYIDAARYCVALGRAFVAEGGELFEHSRATAVEWLRDPVRVRTEAGAVEADHVVLATLLPIVDIGGFFAKARPKRSYAIAVELERQPPGIMAISHDSPKRSVRPWPAARNGLIVAGDGHATGHERETEGHHAALEEWTTANFGPNTLRHRWSAQDYSTFDGLPYIGRSPRTKRCYVATGFDKWGLTNGTAAAILLTDLITGQHNPWLEAFDATRIGDLSALTEMAKENLHVGKQFVTDHAARLNAPSLEQLPPGEGRVVRAGRRSVAAFRDEAGVVHAVEATCTHMGCAVRFNTAERSWDCPCHGSRFAVDGSVLVGPATRPLARVEVEGEPGSG